MTRARGACRWGVVCAVTSMLVSAPALGRAQERSAREVHVEPPPAPEDREPVLAFDVHVSAIAPIANDGLCPGTARCVFGGGGGVGGSVERRFASGFAVALGYDALFIDASGVYEIGVVQFLRAAARFVFFPRELWHLVIDAGVGALVFGETFRVAAAGGAFQLGVGAEVEVTHTIALTAALVTRVLTTTAFRTPDAAVPEGVLRGDGTSFDTALALQLGIQIVEP